MATDTHVPLAERMRPRCLAEVVGQPHLLAPDRPLARAIAAGRPYSMILWGPPGCGKTSLARLCAGDGDFLQLSATLAGVGDVRAAVARARANRAAGRRTLLFVDEVHRFNKAQQDAFLPHVEDGTLVLIGATTENPSFEVNAALLSRCRVHVLKPLLAEAIEAALRGALSEAERGLGRTGLRIEAAALSLLAEAADGDLRRAYGLLESAAELSAGPAIDLDTARAVLGDAARRFDKHGEAFHDQISALHKCLRGSNPDAALYWFCRMLDGGCDPHYLGRRLLRFASEDVGNADPRALSLTLDAWQAYERLGSPEGELALAQAVLYLGVAAKSNACYAALKAGRALVAETGSLEVPLPLRNAPTGLMRALDYGRGYRYDHDEAEGIAFAQAGFPAELGERVLYQPTPRGIEAKIAERLAWIRDRRRKALDGG